MIIKTDTNQNHGALPFSMAPFVILLTATFGVNAIAVKIALSGISIFTLAAIRFSIAIVVIALWAKFSGKSFYIGRKNYSRIAILTVMQVIQLALFFYGIKFTLASRVTLINNVQPFMVMILAHFFIPEDKIKIRKIAGIVLCFSGIFILLKPAGVADSSIMKGDFIILAAVMLWSVNTIYTKKIISDFDPYQLVLYPMIFSLPVFWILAYFFESPMIFNLNLEIVLSVLYQSIITGSIGFVAWNILLNKYGAVSLHTYVFIMPVAGVFFSWLILGEHLAPGVIITLSLVSLGIIISHINPEDLLFFPFKKGGSR
jgi:drug/metabolite transporter (DMT)-like permease